MNRRYQMPSGVIRSFISLCACYDLPREQKWGLNAYLYAPKDDYKHRMYWRDLYSLEEAGEASEICHISINTVFQMGLKVDCVFQINS